MTSGLERREPTLETEVVVVDGRFAGVAAACGAASQGRSVCLVERRTYLRMGLIPPNLEVEIPRRGLLPRELPVAELQEALVQAGLLPAELAGPEELSTHRRVSPRAPGRVRKTPAMPPSPPGR